jgi:hypothetical protein
MFLGRANEFSASNGPAEWRRKQQEQRRLHERTSQRFIHLVIQLLHNFRGRPLWRSEDPRNKPADKAKLKAMIKKWLETKVLDTEWRKDERRKDKEFIIPGPTVMSPNHQADNDDE